MKVSVSEYSVSARPLLGQLRCPRKRGSEGVTHRYTGSKLRLPGSCFFPSLFIQLIVFKQGWDGAGTEPLCESARPTHLPELRGSAAHRPPMKGEPSRIQRVPDVGQPGARFCTPPFLSPCGPSQSHSCWSLRSWVALGWLPVSGHRELGSAEEGRPWPVGPWARFFLL